MDVFPIQKRDLEEMYRMYDTSPEQIETDLEILREWLKKEEHLPQTFQSDAFLRNLLGKCKFSVERTKRKLNAQLTLKSKCREYFDYFETDFILPSRNLITLVALPKLGPEKERIFIGGLKTGPHDKFEFNHWIQAMISVLELSLHYDSSTGVRFVVNFGNLSVEFVKKMDLNKFQHVIALITEGYAARFVSFEILYLSTPAQVVLGILKTIMRSKLFERIHIHQEKESLHKVIPAEYLPYEYGGTQEKLSTLLERADNMMLKNRSFLIESGRFVADESRRVDLITNDIENFGVDGTFKKLNLD